MTGNPFYNCNKAEWEKRKNYEEARNDLMKAKRSFDKLDNEQQIALVNEFAKGEVGMSMIELLQHNMRGHA